MGGRMPESSIEQFYPEFVRTKRLSDESPCSRTAVGMQLLQRAHVHFAPLKRGSAFGGGSGGCQCRDGRDTSGDRSPADGLFVEPRLLAGGCVDDELDALSFDEIDDVGPPFFYFVDALHVHAGRFDHIGSTSRGHKLESHIYKLPRHLRDVPLVVVCDADE